jgi:hypothetical protein
MNQDWCLLDLLELKSMEVYICSVCRQDVYKVPHNIAASQMMKIMEVMVSLLRVNMVNT